MASLVRRRAHDRTLQLAKDLGFLVFQTNHQHVQLSERIAAARFELQDLRMTNSASRALVDWLAGTPHREATTYSDRWMNFSRHAINTFADLRQPTTRWPQRLKLLRGLHRGVEEALGSTEGWSMSDHQPDVLRSSLSG